MVQSDNVNEQYTPPLLYHLSGDAPYEADTGGVCRGAWARVTVDLFRHSALQSGSRDIGYL